MSEAYCRCCRKITPHKMVMRRCQEPSVLTWLVVLLRGEHYVKMEQQAFCRVCNTRTEPLKTKTMPISQAHTVSH